MEPNQSTNTLPTVLILSQSIGDALTMAKSIYLKTHTPSNEKLHGRLSQNIQNIKLDYPFVSEEYTIDTNYYGCNVRLACFAYSSFVPILDSEKTLEEALSELGISSVEGVIFVSNLKPKQQEGVNQYLKYNKEILERLNPEFQMCFANTESTDTEELFELFQFGENEMFVEIVSDNLDEIQPVIPDLSAPKSKFEEKYGMDRVIENIECHMWPNMVRKDVQKNAGDKKKEVAEKAKEVSKPVEENKENKTAIEEAPKKAQKEDASKKEDEKAEEVAKPVSENSEKEKKTETKPAEVKEVPKPQQNPLEYFDEDEDEEDMQDLAAVLETVRQFKENSKGLTDEVRKERAAELIMKLVANCKDLQDGSDEEDDE